jgi:tetratricopeptide (TPR) repeat protein
MPILSSQPLVDHLLRLGDTEVMKALLDGLGDADPEIAGLGASISRVAWLEEFHGGVKKSAGTYERASAALSEDVDTDRPWLAEGLHARARVINQQPNPTVEQLAAARALLRKAIQLRDDDTVGVATHEALDALLQRAESQFLPWQSDERINMLHEVERTLMASYAVRAEHGDERLADRAYFNLAGTYIQLAQQEPARALEHLAAAEEVYERTLRFRRGRYSAPSAIAASCISGLATVAFYRAVLRPDFLTTPLDAGVSELLDTATSYELDALRERQSIAGVDPDTGDAAKSYRMLAKIFTARFWRPSGGSGRASFVRELARELQHGPNSEV